MIAAELIERHLVFPKLVSRESVFEVPAEQFLIQLVLLREAGRVDCIEPIQEPAPLSSGGTAASTITGTPFGRAIAQAFSIDNSPFSAAGQERIITMAVCGDRAASNCAAVSTSTIFTPSMRTAWSYSLRE